jgi:hypothetical protein
MSYRALSAASAAGVSSAFKETAILAAGILICTELIGFAESTRGTAAIVATVFICARTQAAGAVITNSCSLAAAAGAFAAIRSALTAIAVWHAADAIGARILSLWALPAGATAAIRATYPANAVCCAAIPITVALFRFFTASAAATAIIWTAVSPAACWSAAYGIYTDIVSLAETTFATAAIVSALFVFTIWSAASSVLVALEVTLTFT